jgi:hypothetical protein
VVAVEQVPLDKQHQVAVKQALVVLAQHLL